MYKRTIYILMITMAVCFLLSGMFVVMAGEIDEIEWETYERDKFLFNYPEDWYIISTRETSENEEIIAEEILIGDEKNEIDSHQMFGFAYKPLEYNLKEVTEEEWQWFKDITLIEENGDSIETHFSEALELKVDGYPAIKIIWDEIKEDEIEFRNDIDVGQEMKIDYIEVILIYKDKSIHQMFYFSAEEKKNDDLLNKIIDSFEFKQE